MRGQIEVKSRARLGKVVDSSPTKRIASRLSEKRKTKLDMKHIIIKNICHYLFDIILNLMKMNQYRNLSAIKKLPRGYRAYTDDKAHDYFSDC